MKNVMKRSFAVLMSLVMCVSMLFGMSFSAQAATVDYVYSGNYVYNWGERETEATFLSPMAETFYTENGTSYEALSALSGSSTESSVPSSALYAELQTLMESNHTYINSYDAIKDLCMYTDCQNSGGKISSFYSGTEIGPEWNSSEWNREHTWPNSKGDLSGSGENDIMMIRPTAISENSSRGNKAYGTTTNTQYYNPNDEGNGNYDLRGDVARIILYQYVRWECINTGSSYNSTGIFGADGVIESQDVLLTWIEEDPVDTWELGRNDSVESITGTRNVFVDYPELAFELFEEEIPVHQTPSGIANGGTDSSGGSTGEDGGNTGTESGGDTTGGETTEVTATITFDDTSKRTTFTTSQQIWEENGVTVTNNKASSSSNVADYSNPVRFYKSSELIVDHTYPINKIEITASSSDYATALSNSISDNNATVTVSGSVVTIVFTEAVDTFTIASLSAQTRISSMTVYAAQTTGGDGGESGGNTGEEGGDTTPDITGDCYVKVLASLDDWSGEYLIVYEDGSVALNGGLDTLDVASNNIAVTITDNKIAANDATNAAKFTIEKTSDGYTVKSASGYYIGNDAAATNQISSSIENQYLNTLSFDYTNTSVNIMGVGGYLLQYNSDANATRFRYYGGTQNPVALYKLTTAFDGGYTVTATPNDESLGTVSVIDNVVYAQPNAGYVVSDYTVTSGAATVTTNGDTFTVDATGDVALTVNFVPGDNTVTFVENGTAVSSTTAKTGDIITLPTSIGTLGTGEIFVGWLTDGSSDILTPGSTYTITAETIFYAQYRIAESGDTSGETTGYYEKVTSAPDDWSGEYLIVYEDGSVAFDGSLTTLDGISNTIAVTITDNKIEATNTKASQFVIAKSGDNYTVQSASGLYIGRSTDSNELDESTTTAYTNTITINSDGSVNIIGSGGAYLRFNASSNQLRFRYYKSSTYTNQKAIALYKLVEVDTAEPVPTGNILGAQIEVGASLTLNYYASLTNIADDAQVELRVTMLGKETTIERDITNIVDGKYVFTFDGITTQCMTELIDAELVLVDSEGETVLNTKEGYSIQENAINLLTAYPDDAALKQFVTDMLYYGAASQTYRGYNTENLATIGVEGLGSPSDVLPSDDDAMSLINNADATIGDVYFKSATVWFDSINNLIINLNSATDNTELRLNGEAVMSGAGNTVYTTEEIRATDFNKIYVFELYENGVLVQTLSYSVNSYAYSKQSSSNSAMKELAIALYRYGVSAKAYAASLQ